MNEMVLINARIAADEVIENGYIWIKGETIDQVGEMADCPPLNTMDKVIDCKKGEWIIPGMIDLHIHGASGSDVMDATPEALETMANVLPEEGTTSFLATTITSSKQETEAALENAAAFMNSKNTPGKAEIIGIHLEGPFINREKKGAQPEQYIIEPEVGLFERWQRLADNGIRLVTLAPELDHDHGLIRHLEESGVIASMGHTKADFDQVQKAIRHGLSHVTHLYNAMEGIHHREPGTAGAALLLDELMVEVIADGVHSHPDMVKLAYRSKSAENLVLITDSMRAKCLRNGTYELGGQEVRVENDRAVLSNGSLAGSLLKMNVAYHNMQKWTSASIGELTAMTAGNQARELGMDDRKGSIAEGKDADLVLLDQDHKVLLTICRGEIAYRQED